MRLKGLCYNVCAHSMTVVSNILLNFHFYQNQIFQYFLHKNAWMKFSVFVEQLLLDTCTMNYNTIQTDMGYVS